MPPRPLLELCEDPYATRRRADRGLDVPCYRCFYEEPGVGRGCKAVNRGMKVDRSGPRRVEPSRAAPAQTVLDWGSPHSRHDAGTRDLPPEKE